MNLLTSLDVPVHFFSQGITWEEVFQRQAPLKVEVCSGKDEFIIRMAEQDPAANFIGIERSLAISSKLLSKVDRSGLANIRVVREDAHLVFPECFKNEQIDTIFINFPDPWPKRRHHKRRLINKPFTQQMVEKLKPGGMLQFASDHKEYAFWALMHFEENPRLENVNGSGGIQYELVGYPPTIFMKKYIPQGRKFHFLRFRKK